MARQPDPRAAAVRTVYSVRTHVTDIACVHGDDVFTFPSKPHVDTLSPSSYVREYRGSALDDGYITLLNKYSGCSERPSGGKNINKNRSRLVSRSDSFVPF